MLNRSIRALTLILGVAATAALAQGPAEVPPASYDGRSYVDSAGCVFIRVSVDGKVTWVPRVTRSREPVCGQSPSLPGETVVAAATPVPVPAPVATPAPKPVKKVAVSRPAKKVVRHAAPARQVTPQRVVRPSIPAGTVLRKEEIPHGVRVVPRHVYENNRGTNVQVVAPEGYRPAFRDDRLNPRRAEMNRSGIYATERVWTDTVPRKLRRGEAGRGATVYVNSPTVSSKGRVTRPSQERFSR